MIIENDLLTGVVLHKFAATLGSLTYRPTRRGILTGCSNQLEEAGINAQFFNEICKEGLDQGEGGSTASFRVSAAQLPLTLEKTFQLHGEPVLTIEEKLVNAGDRELEFLWGRSFALDSAIIDAHCRIVTSAVSYFDSKEDPMLRMRWPLLADGGDLSAVRNLLSGEARPVYLADFGEGFLHIDSPTHKLAVELRWNAQTFPYCWLQADAGMLYLSPYTGLPSAESEGHGLLTLPAGASETAKFEIKVVPG